jgi:hypothetical protein
VSASFFYLNSQRYMTQNISYQMLADTHGYQSLLAAKLRLLSDTSVTAGDKVVLNMFTIHPDLSQEGKVLALVTIF